MKKWLLLILVVIGVGIWLGWSVWSPPKLPAIPDLPNEIGDPPVVQLLQQKQQAVQAQPTNSQAWAEYAMVLHAHVYPQQAKVAYHATSLLDRYAGKWLYAQALLSSTSPNEERIDLLQNALSRQVEPKLKQQMHFFLGDLLQEQAEYANAEKQYMRVIAEDANHPLARFGMANLGFARGEDLDAIPILTSLIRSPFIRRKSAALLAQIHRRRGNQGEANHYEQLASQLPADQSMADPFLQEVAQFQVGRQGMIEQIAQYELAEAFEQAVQVGEKLLQLYPNATSQFLLGKSLIQANQDERGVQLLRQAVQENRKQVLAWTFLGIGEYRLARAAEKKNLLTQAEAGFTQAIQALEEARKFALDFPPCLQYLAEVYANRKRAQDAIRIYRELLELRPEMVSIYFDFAELLYREQEVATAKLQLQKGLQLRPDDPRGLELQRLWLKK